MKNAHNLSCKQDQTWIWTITILTNYCTALWNTLKILSKRKTLKHCRLRSVIVLTWKYLALNPILGRLRNSLRGICARNFMTILSDKSNNLNQLLVIKQLVLMKLLYWCCKSIHFAKCIFFYMDLNSLLNIWSMVSFLTGDRGLVPLRQLNGSR